MREKNTTIGSVRRVDERVRSNSEEREPIRFGFRGSSCERKSIGSEVDKLNKGSSREHVASRPRIQFRLEKRSGVSLFKSRRIVALVDRACSVARRSPTRTRRITSRQLLLRSLEFLLQVAQQFYLLLDPEHNVRQHVTCLLEFFSVKINANWIISNFTRFKRLSYLALSLSPSLSLSFYRVSNLPKSEQKSSRTANYRIEQRQEGARFALELHAQTS